MFDRDQETHTLKVNFGRGTLAILNEVKHLSKDFPKREVPEKAKEVFRRFDDLRNYNNSLEQVDSDQIFHVTGKGRHKKKSIFLGNSPKQQTQPTHPYGLGLT